MAYEGFLPGKPTLIGKATEIPPIAPTTWGELSGIQDISSLPLVRAVGDTTEYGPSFYRDHMKLLFDKIEVSLTFYYTTGEYVVFRDLLDEGVTAAQHGNNWWRIIYPDNSNETFVACVTKVEPAAPRDEIITFDVTLTLSGDVVYTAPV